MKLPKHAANGKQDPVVDANRTSPFEKCFPEKGDCRLARIGRDQQAMGEVAIWAVGIDDRTMTHIESDVTALTDPNAEDVCRQGMPLPGRRLVRSGKNRPVAGESLLPLVRWTVRGGDSIPVKVRGQNPTVEEIFSPQQVVAAQVEVIIHAIGPVYAAS